ELFDVVEAIIDLPNENIRAGMRGTIVEDFSDGAYLVEFANEYGETLEMPALTITQFIVVWRDATHAPVSVAEQAAALVANLPDNAAHQVLDFARFLAARSPQAAPAQAAPIYIEEPVLA
ncbi:MAG: DUF4926 domain-containing protein, partial [Chloroflexota bacterium]|nr:DUF4926 domain-containing protein [Chloroflexota bacterium]